MRFPIKISTKKLRFPIKQDSQKVRFPVISEAKKVRFPKNLCLNKAYTKSFDKNSSLVTTGYKTLGHNSLQCDELYFQLITPKSPSQGCDEFTQQLITS